MRQWLQEGGRDASLEANRPFFLQVLHGLQHIHANSLIHRDLTPNNVFITADGTFKIGDFGLSREMSSSLNGMTQGEALTQGEAILAAAPPLPRRALSTEKNWLARASRSVTRGVGTSLYMSPEQRANREYGHKVDVYSAGVIFLEMCYPLNTQMERVKVLSALQRLRDELRNPQLIYASTLDPAAERLRVMLCALGLHATLERQGKAGQQKALQDTLERLRKASKSEVPPLLPLLQQQVTEMAAVADLDALLVEELLRASEILTDITMDLEYRGGTRGSKQSGKSGGSGALGSEYLPRGK